MARIPRAARQTAEGQSPDHQAPLNATSVVPISRVARQVDASVAADGKFWRRVAGTMFSGHFWPLLAAAGPLSYEKTLAGRRVSDMIGAWATCRILSISS